MDDLKIRDFKIKIIELMNKTPISLEVKRLVLSELLNETTTLVDEELKKCISTLHNETEKSDSENSPE